ncbi:DUF4369 domain-containing protein [Zunongwangia endophytica]|uniref:DUF4369 domain-containing protein n=1 Tax=Zunongwangia endophytica TaxID=1808945 RepID=A0ABV8H606_9FLAO|nr:DUF4369 domain-containing protein [Zunongwangia endophytica]MDN3594978.1 DUF4369 domain-containing protein [Zunongwangia endophytica]
MKKISLLLLLVLTIIACSQKETNLKVSGNIKGLKKGTLFLQMIDDTSLVSVDSVEINGDSNFLLQADIDSPQMMYLYLNKVDNSEFDDRLDFFADEGETKIITSLEKFETDAKITGSVNQEKLIEYRKMMSRFNDSNLEIIKENFEAQKAEDDDKLIELDKRYESLLKRKYLYTVNFALNNKDLEVAPYLALSEVFDANIKYLDTIYSSLEKDVRKSKYGKQLKKFLKERREEEKLEDEIEADNTEANS